MKMYRILGYATLGVIAGLLLENKLLFCKAEAAEKKLDKQKKKEEEKNDRAKG